MGKRRPWQCAFAPGGAPSRSTALWLTSAPSAAAAAIRPGPSVSKGAAGSRTRVCSGATLYVDHSLAFPGSVTVDGTLTLASGGVSLGIQGILTLDASGTINNPGAISAGSFVNNGGVINGNAPDSNGLVVLRITRVAVVGPTPQSQVRNPSTATPRPRTVSLECQGLPGHTFTVETSLDLRQWQPIAAECTETSPGVFRVSVSVPDADRRFFRLRTSAGK